MYNPVVGRWLSPDPLGSPQGVPELVYSHVDVAAKMRATLQPYVYADNDPTNRVDPSGLSSEGGPGKEAFFKHHTGKPEGCIVIGILGKGGKADNTESAMFKAMAKVSEQHTAITASHDLDFSAALVPETINQHCKSWLSCKGVCFVLVGHSYGGEAAMRLVDKLDPIVKKQCGEHAPPLIALFTIDAIKPPTTAAAITPPINKVKTFINYYQRLPVAKNPSGLGILAADTNVELKGKLSEYLSKNERRIPHQGIDDYLVDESAIDGMTLSEWVNKTADQLAADIVLKRK